MKKKLKLNLLRTSLCMLVLLIIGCIWQKVMINCENDKYKAVGNFVDVGTYKAHYYTKGSGNITFVLISGSGTPCSYTDYYYLQNELSKHGQTISFDHAGLGWSSKTNAKRDIDRLTEELSIIINSVAKDNKVVLIAHSLGSLEAIRYTQRNLEKVLGIVFIDGGSPQFYSEDFELKSLALNRVLAVFRVTGMNRFLGQCNVMLPMYGENIRNENLPQFLKKTDKVMYYKYTGDPSNFEGIKDINENGAKVMGNISLGNIPILVLSSDNGEEWATAQKQLSEWSDNSQQITIRNTSHYLHWSNSAEVIKYIHIFLRKNHINIGN